MVTRSIQQPKCGYSVRFFEESNSVADNIRKIQFKSRVNGMPIAAVDVNEFFDQAARVPSKYNPPKIRALFTSSESGHHAIANIKFGDKTVQFIAVDGGSLSSWEYQNPDRVINRVNNGDLRPIVFPSLTKLSVDQMTKIDAYAGSMWYCLFLNDIFGRVGIIDDNAVFLSVVNVDMANAFWNSHYMTYGNGRERGAPEMGPLTSIDVVGHEAGHGIVEALGGLVYQGESGALNESIADVFGTCLERYYDIKSNKQLFDWDLGEDFMSGGMRSLSNPKSHRQPDTYKGENWVDTNSGFDNGGVHVNSGIGNYLFYVTATAGQGVNDRGQEYQVRDAFQLFKLAKFIYQSLAGTNGFDKIHNRSSYDEYANCLLNNCQRYLETSDLNSNWLYSLGEGLVAVGLKTRSEVPGGAEPPHSPPTPEPVPEEPEIPEQPEESPHVPDGGAEPPHSPPTPEPVPEEPEIPEQPEESPHVPDGGTSSPHSPHIPEMPEESPLVPEPESIVIRHESLNANQTMFYISDGFYFYDWNGLRAFSGTQLTAKLPAVNKGVFSVILENSHNPVNVSFYVDEQWYEYQWPASGSDGYRQLSANIPRSQSGKELILAVEIGRDHGWCLGGVKFTEVTITGVPI